MVLRGNPEDIWTMSSLPRVSVGLLGLGTVGAEVLRLLADEAQIAERAGVRIVPVKAAVAHPDKTRGGGTPQ